MRTYGEDDDDLDDERKETWIELGIFASCIVKPMDKWEPRGSRLLMALTRVYIGDFSFEVVWTEYFHKIIH
jgi:hypothetical protein